jgi:hypothetical protein
MININNIHHPQPSHTKVDLFLDPSDLSLLRSINHEPFLKDLVYDSISSKAFDPYHYIRLREDVLQNDILFPIVLLKRRLYGDVQVIDGLHRALLAIEYNIPVKTELNICFCLTTYLDAQSVCVETRNSIEEYENQAKEVGWHLDRILVS